MSKRYTWIMLIALFVAAVAAPVNMYKVPPVMPVLMDVFGLDLTSANLLMSVFAVAGLALAIPAGLIVQRIGPKRSGLIAIASVIVGSALGALSSGTAMLLASRAGSDLIEAGSAQVQRTVSVVSPPSPTSAPMT